MIKNIPLLQGVYYTVAIIGAVYTATMFISSSLDRGLREVKTDWIDESRRPFYLSVESGLQKQLEKLSKNPNDLKHADIKLYSDLCAEDFGKKYVEQLPATRKLDARKACDMITDLYINR